MNLDDPESSVLWRYIDIPSLLWLLERRHLLFTWPERFADPFEGEYARPFVEKMRAFEGEGAEANRRFFERMREFNCAVSCWHAHEHENALMWRSYSGSLGVAIKTTRQILRSVLPLSISIESVQYVDFETADIPYGNLFDRLKYKRLEFAFEREVRALSWDHPLGQEGTAILNLGAAGMGVPIDPAKMIQDIRVCPELSPWFVESLSRVVKALGYSIPVSASKSSGEPFRFYKHSSITALTPWDEVESTKIPRYLFTTVDAAGEKTESAE